METFGPAQTPVPTLDDLRRQKPEPYVPRERDARPEGSLTSREVCKLLDITYRQLDYWARKGWVEGQPAGTTSPGWVRYWTPEQVVRVMQISCVHQAIDKLLEANDLPALFENYARRDR